MKLTCILLLVNILQVTASSYAQKVSLMFKNAQLEDVIIEIQQQSGYDFLYSSQLLKEANPVTLSVNNASIDDVLKKCMEGQPFSYIVNKKTVTIKALNNLNKIIAIKIVGKVTDERGQPIAGVSIRNKNTGQGTITDKSGNYSLTVPNGNTVLEYSYVGFRNQVVEVNGRTTINVSLSEDAQGLDQIVIVGYGVQKKATVTGAISSISTKDLLQSPQANISNSLVGRLPGLLAVQRSGQPGEDQSTLRIRGIGTFSGSQEPLVMVDGIEGVNYNNIDPNEIETISILKDASATAVYGVRGANGVLLITTKRGKLGAPQVSLTSNFALTQFTDMREGVSSYDYANGFNEALKYDSYITGGYTPKFSEEAIAKYKSGEDPLFYPSVDWFKKMYAPSSSQMQHNLSFSGGVKGVKYFASAGYFNQQGLFSKEVVSAVEEYNAQPVYNRYNFRANLDFDIFKNFTANVNISSQTEERKGNTSTINRTIELATKANPLSSPGLVDGMLIYLPTAPTFLTAIDQLLRSGYSRGYRNYLNGSVRLNYELSQLVKGLKTHATISYLNFNSQEGTFPNIMVAHMPKRLPDGSVVFIPQGDPSPFYYNESVSKYRREYAEFGFEYARSFKSHNIGGMVNYNQNKLYDPNLAFLVPRGYQGLVGRVTYNFDQRYLAEFNIGYNGTENFAEGKRFGFFPAYSLGWLASEESFFPKNDVVTMLKIRGSSGEVGNDQVGGDRFLYMPSSYGYTANYYNFGTYGLDLNGYQGSTEGKIGNPDLTWERAKKTNIGLEMGIWKDHIKITADWFNETRDNILASLGTVPTIVGAVLPAQNLGKMKNSGFDGDISYNNSINQFNYWIKANFTYAKNVVQFKDEASKLYAYQNQTGQRYGQYFGLIAEGLYNTWEEVNDPNRPISQWNSNKIQPGDIKYRDVNADGFLNSDDEVPIGYSNFPEKIYGISFGGSYKGFDFSALLQGADNVSVSYSRHARYGFREDAGVPDYILERSWTQERYEQGLPIDFPHLSEGDTNQKHNYTPSTFWVRDASYLRLKNAELGYTISGTLAKKLGIGSVRVFANGNNLITWSDMLPGIDPESNVAGTNSEPYPLTRTINFGLNVRF